MLPKDCRWVEHIAINVSFRQTNILWKFQYKESQIGLVVITKLQAEAKNYAGAIVCLYLQ